MQRDYDILLRFLCISFLIVVHSIFLYSQSSVGTMSDLRALAPGVSSQVNVAGYYQSGDGGGGTFYWDAASTEVDNHGTIIRPLAGGTGRWKRSYNDHINVLWFGATGDDRPNDNNHIRIMNAANYAVKNTGKLYIPRGIYQLRSRLVFNETHNGLEVYGDELKYKWVSPDEIPGPNVQTLNRNSITWSPTVRYLSDGVTPNPNYDPDYKFRVIDENASTVLKAADNANAPAVILQIGHTGTMDGQTLRKIDGIVFRNLGFNGNKEKIWNSSDLNIRVIPLPPAPAGQSSTYHWGQMASIVRELLFENIASYNCSKTSFINWGGPGVYVKHYLGYSNGWQGFGNSYGYVHAEDIETHNNGWDEVYRSLSAGGGYCGIDYSAGSGKLVRAHAHHNWMGFKTSVSAEKNTILDSIFEYNFINGVRHDGAAPAREMYYDNIITRHNGSYGFRPGSEGIVKVGSVESYDNGKSTFYGIATNIVLEGSIIDTLISHSYVGESERSVLIYGNNDIGYLEVRDNNTLGVDLQDNSKTYIRSGRIYNNYNAGIRIGKNATAYIYNIQFGSDKRSSSQTFIEIYDLGNGTLYHSGLDFSNSNVNPENHIRVSNTKRVNE